MRAGGHAAVVQDGGRIDVLIGVDTRGKISELGRWALLSIEIARWRRVKGGPAQGLAAVRVAPEYEWAVLDWCARDMAHEGPTRVLSLDCMDCAACCHDANVVLDQADLGRWREAGRPDLAGRAYVRRARDGKMTLRFAASGRCQHLGEDRRCGIYALRPDNCRAFVIGSEACLAAREETLGLRDGLPVDE